MSYSQYFDFKSGPTLDRELSNPPTNVMWRYGQPQHYRDVVTPGKMSKEQEDAAEEFDYIMSGHDTKTGQYVNTLKSIYDGYSRYAKEYEGDVQPIIDSLTGDIENMEGYIDDYQKLLADNKDTFLNGIVLDPNASRTRAEYTGAIADQYEVAKETLGRDMASQGLNPYSNKGANRELELDRAKNIGLASGQAYTDWRASYNRDKQAQQGATAQFIGLQSDVGEQQSSIINARKGIGDFYGNILGSKISADKERATGYESLTSLAESRRAETLALNQQKQENVRQEYDIKQQMDAKRKKGGAVFHNFE